MKILNIPVSEEDRLLFDKQLGPWWPQLFAKLLMDEMRRQSREKSPDGRPQTMKQTVFVNETPPKLDPLPESVKRYIRDVPAIATVIHRGVPERESMLY